MTLEDLLTELSSSGWTVSWAFQFAEGHWRVSICELGQWNGIDQPDFRISHCADAPTFRDALEDAMAVRNEAEWAAGQKVSVTIEKTKSLSEALNLRAKAKPFDDRRI